MSLARATKEHDWDSSRRWPAMGAILALHAVALWGLMQIESFREAVKDAAPIMVGLITLAPPEPPKPPPPKPPEIKPKPKPQMIAAETPAPAPIEAPPPEPVVFEEPAPPPPGEPAPLPVVPPNFVAAYLDNPAPRYPDSSKRLGEAGLVVLRVRVNTEGRPELVEIEKSCGFQRLDRAALDAVRKWKFVPAKQGEQPVAATVLVPLNFELKNA